MAANQQIVLWGILQDKVVAVPIVASAHVLLVICQQLVPI